MKQLILISALLLAGAMGAWAQVDTLWTETYGGERQEGFRDLVATPDGGCLAVGYTYSFGSGDADIYVVKTDAGGHLAWTRTYGGPDREYGWGLCATGDGNFALVGQQTDLATGDMDLYLLKISPAGAPLWEKTYGRAGADEGFDLMETSDGYLVITGRTEFLETGESDLFLLKTDAAGDTLWTRTLGGAESDWGSAVCELSDGFYGICGTTGSVTGNRDIYVVKVAPDGSIVWAEGYGSSTDLDADWGSGLCAAEDGGMVVVGHGNDHVLYDALDIWLIRIDGSGQSLWERRFGAPGNYYDYGTNLCATSDAGYLICGVTKDPATQENSIYVVKTDDAGIEAWNHTVGGIRSDWASRVLECSPGRYRIAGHTESFGAGRFDGWLLDLYDPTVQSATPPLVVGAALLRRPLSPFRPGGTLHFELFQPAHVQIEMVDATGRRVATLCDASYQPGHHALTWRASAQESGIYYCVMSVGERMASQKLMLIK